MLQGVPTSSSSLGAAAAAVNAASIHGQYRPYERLHEAQDAIKLDDNALSMLLQVRE